METEPVPKPLLLTGNEAVALAAMEAGLKFFAGYPITPSSEIAESLSHLLPKSGGVFIQKEDEIAAISAVVGASIAGAKAMTATSGPGYSLMQEGIGFACEAEVPCVVVNVMRGGPSTGMPTLPSQGDVMQSRWGPHGDHPAVVLSPERVSEAYEMTLHAFDISEKLRMPVTLLMEEIVGHLTEKIWLPLRRKITVASNRETSLGPSEYRPYLYSGQLPPPLVPFGKGYRYHVTGLLHDETGFPSNDPKNADRQLRWLMRKVAQNKDLLLKADVEGAEDAQILLFAYGAVSRSAKSAMKTARAKGQKVGLFRPRTIWPFPEEELAEAAKNVQVVIPVEMNLGQLTHEVVRVIGARVRVEPLYKVGGEPVFPEEISRVIERVLS